MASWTLGYYGKLPLSPEFIRHQASGPEIDELDQWFREGMYYAKSRTSSWSMDFIQSDVWRFLYFPRDRSRLMIGLMKPSHDQAGREFPFLIYLLLKRAEFAKRPWCAPMHFRDFFSQGQRVLTDVGMESNLPRLQFRLQALAPVHGPTSLSAVEEYEAELMGRRMSEYWTELFGIGQQRQKYALLTPLLRNKMMKLPVQHQARFPLIPLTTEETYDVPFWMDVTTHIWGYDCDTGVVLWNRMSTKVRPVLFVSQERPTPELLQCLIFPEQWEKGEGATAETTGGLSEADRTLLDEDGLTLQEFLNRLPALKVGESVEAEDR
jgi:type VI secretion system protein ImpM